MASSMQDLAARRTAFQGDPFRILQYPLVERALTLDELQGLQAICAWLRTCHPAEESIHSINAAYSLIEDHCANDEEWAGLVTWMKKKQNEIALLDAEAGAAMEPKMVEFSQDAAPKIRTESDARIQSPMQSPNTVADKVSRTSLWLAASPAWNKTTENVDIHISEELSLATFEVARSWSKIKRRHNAEDIVAKLCIWNQNFPDGRLSLIVTRADELRETILYLLQEIGSLLCHGKQTSMATRGRILKVTDLADMANEDSSALYEGYTCEGLKSLLEKSFLIASNPGLQEQDTSSNSSEETDIVDAIQDLANQLLELVPALGQFYSHLQLINPIQMTRLQDFHVSTAALPFVQSIIDGFRDADPRLAERLGEANWQRFQVLRARMNQPRKTIALQEEIPQSLFVPQTHFRDSGVSSSTVAEPLDDSSSAASHSSFASSVDEDKQGTSRVPETPAAISDGKPFECQLCRRKLAHIRNRNHWKMHVFADLNAYICTFPECAEQLTTFSSRETWAQHEFSEHRSQRIWSCPECHDKANSAEAMRAHLSTAHFRTMSNSQILSLVDAAFSIQPATIDDQQCPLCLKVPGKSKENFVRHVAKHLESIALTVLPRELKGKLYRHAPNTGRSYNLDDPYPMSSASTLIASSQAGESEAPEVEIFKSFRVGMDDTCVKVLPAALRKYNIQGDWREYALYIVYGDQERPLGLDEKPLIMFKQLNREGKKPMFMLRKHVPPSEGRSGPRPPNRS